MKTLFILGLIYISQFAKAQTAPPLPDSLHPGPGAVDSYGWRMFKVERVDRTSVQISICKPKVVGTTSLEFSEEKGSCYLVGPLSKYNLESLIKQLRARENSNDEKTRFISRDLREKIESDILVQRRSESKFMSGTILILDYSNLINEIYGVTTN